MNPWKKIVILAIIGAAGLGSISGCRHVEDVREQRSFEFTYRFTVTNLPSGAEQVTAWAPLPAQHRYQRVENLRIASAYPHRIVEDPMYSNRILRIDFSAEPTAEGAERTARITFEAVRCAYDVLKGDPPPVHAPHLEPADYLKALSSVPTGGVIAAEAKRISAGLTNHMEMARRLYDHIVSSMDYDKTGEGWGRGDAVYACNIRTGNCTDFHSLFMGEARALNLPARFIIGFSLSEESGEIDGYHCWAEIYIAGTGWLPVDASEAHKHPEKKERFFGGLDAQRVEFIIGRDIPLDNAKQSPLNFFIYPHVEVDGKKHKDVAKTFTVENHPR